MTRQQREMGLSRVLQGHLRTYPCVTQTFQLPTFYELNASPSDATGDQTFKHRGILGPSNLKLYN